MRRRRCIRRLHGLSLVELLIGMAVGLVVVAAGSSVVLDNVRENRALGLEMRLMDDLRTAADIVSRDLRRAGYWADAAAGVRSDDGSAVAADPYAAVSPDAAASDAVRFRFSRDATENNVVDSNEQFGFRLHNGAIELQLGDANWQAITDATVLTVTAFAVLPGIEETSLAGFCVDPCPAGSTVCPPRQQVKRFDVSVAGRSVVDPRVQRSLRTSVRLRRLGLLGSCTA